MDISLEKTLPWNSDAERMFLGAVLLETAMPADVSPDDLYLDGHKRILRSMKALSDRSEPINLLSVKNELQINGELEAAGGAAYLVSLTDGLPRIELAPQYIRMIRRSAALRQLISVGNNAVIKGYSGEEEPQDIINDLIQGCDNAATMLEENAGLKHIGSYVSDVYRELEARSNQKQSDAYSTGFTEIDRLLAGGVRPQDQVIIAGRPGHGKTAFLTNVIINQAFKGINCAYFSLEMGSLQIVERMLSVIAEVDGAKMRMGYLNREDWIKLGRAAGALSQLPIYIDDSTSITVADVRARIRRISISIQMVGIDYLQLLSPPESLRRNADETTQISAISRSLKFMAKNMNLGLMTVSQLSRASEKRTDRRPQLSDLRSSGQIEQDADVVMFVYREEMRNPTDENAGLSEIIIEKQRNGPIGDVKLAYIKNYTKFANLWPES